MKNNGNVKVLIIEDDQDTVEVISMAFQLHWPEVSFVSAKMGGEGIELVASESPDVVILDLGLPDMDGFEVLQRIRRSSEVPVMILSVRKDEASVVKALKYGADEYVTKPFRQTELLERLKALVLKKMGVVRDERDSRGLSWAN